MIIVKGYILAEDLVDFLREKGEPMTEEDVDNLLCEISIDGDNRIRIEDFVQHMFATSAPDSLPLVETLSDSPDRDAYSNYNNYD